MFLLVVKMPCTPRDRTILQLLRQTRDISHQLTNHEINLQCMYSDEVYALIPSLNFIVDDYLRILLWFVEEHYISLG